MTGRLTQERAHQFLIYNPLTGSLTHRGRTPTKRADEVATRHDNYGYLNVNVDGVSYKAHRVAWLYFYGRWPRGQIDHINGDRADNRIENLREANYQENGQNRAIQSNNRSGYPGVSWRSSTRNWRAQISARGRRHHLGTFKTAEEASQAYLDAKAKLHDFQPKPRDLAGRVAGKAQKAKSSR